MDVVEIPIERLVPYARNPRRNEEAVAAVAASLAEFGWRQPIVVDAAMVIVAGHTRYAAAQRLGLTHVPVHVARGLTPAQIRAYRLMDSPADAVEAPAPESAASPPGLAAPIPDPAPAIAPEPASAAVADRLRAEYAEIAAVAAQATRLGIAIDAAEAMRQGTKPDALRRSVLDALAARSEATAAVIAAPAPASAGDSPIVRRARERASALGADPASRS